LTQPVDELLAEQPAEVPIGFRETGHPNRAEESMASDESDEGCQWCIREGSQVSPQPRLAPRRLTSHGRSERPEQAGLGDLATHREPIERVRWRFHSVFSAFADSFADSP
jgi:hypothetical protein